MKLFSNAFFSLFLIFGISFAQELSKDISQTPSNYNNPEYVYGPALEGPLGILSESFEGATFPPTGWLKANPDGGTGWNRQTVGTTPIPGWTGGDITAPPGGGSAVAFCTWNTGGATANDQWLISPQIMNVQTGDELSLWIRIFGNATYLEQVDIRISTTGTNVANFTTLVEALVWNPGTANDTAWVRYTYQLTNHVTAGSNIYIGIREHVLDNINQGGAVMLDKIEVTSGGGGGTDFFDDFEAYTPGIQLTVQNPVDWTTWTGTPGTGEDPFVSNAFAYSGSNSVRIIQNNDLVKLLGSKTTGRWYMSCWIYIPTGKAGYFNTMNGFTPNPFQWGMEVYFDAGGVGRLVNAATTNFTWTANTWQFAQVIVDLDIDEAQFWFNGAQVGTSWQWTRGNPGSYALRLDAQDIFGATANDEMFFDNYWFADHPVPVELTSFTAVANNGVVELNWVTATEVNNQMFEIQRCLGENEFFTIGFIEGHGTTSEPQQYSFTDRNIVSGIYSYRLKQIDYDGSYEYSDVVEVEVMPAGFSMDQNYPNPFNPSTSIKYSIPESGNIKLAVYNLIGEEVAVLVNGVVQAGQYQINFDAANLPSGVYLYKLQSANSVEVKKMMLMK